MSRRNRGPVALVVGTLFTIIGILQLLFGTYSLLGGPGYAPLPFGMFFMIVGVAYVARPKA
jgi:hypothetical protein